MHFYTNDYKEGRLVFPFRSIEKGIDGEGVSCMIILLDGPLSKPL
jgi:hypothetical protein